MEKCFAGFKEIARMAGREPNRTTRVYFYRLMRRGAFPAAIQVSDNRIAWDRAAVLRWMASRPAVRYASGSSGPGNDRSGDERCGADR